MPPTDSCSYSEHFLQFWRSFPIVEAICENSEDKGFHPGNRLIPRRTINHRSGNFRHFRNPPAVIFNLHFDIHAFNILTHSRFSTLLR
jgi:hypothetical protein